jgi:type IV pilus assembly protein PilC
MVDFLARVGWPDGAIGEERIQAPDPAAARADIERRGGHVFALERQGLGLFSTSGRRRGRIKTSDFLIFNQELIALLKAGLPIVRSLELLGERQRSPTLQRVLSDVKGRVIAGESLSDAFAVEGDLFPRLYATTLRAGEKSGELESVLRRYLKYLRTIVALQRKVIGTLVYPGVLITLSAVLITILMTFVIPRFVEFFKDFEAQLPLLTRIVIAFATFLKTNFPLILAGLISGGFVLWRFVKTPSGRDRIDFARLRIPVLGGIFQRFAITQFTRALGTLLAGGTPLVPALEIGADAIGNRHVARRVREVAPRIREGGELWKALESTELFTDLTVEMIKVGETSGALEEMLGSVSEFYEEEIDARLSRVISFVEPAILVIMGGVIATILLSVYLPIFTIISNLNT